MTSVIAWLDASDNQSRRMREIVNLFTQSESRDELGIGQIRDAFSDSLFPGTSTLQTRARYLLFIPWCFQAAVKSAGPGQAAENLADQNEQRVITTLSAAGETEGLIGRVAGPAVKTLPSAIYATALRQYGILRAPDFRAATMWQDRRDAVDEELADRAGTPWSPTIPAAPNGFPRQIEGGFDLTADEADWLQLRIKTETAGTLLAHLVSEGGRPQPTSDAPWDDPACQTASPENLAILNHARLFSAAMHGAALLYNYLIAERYEAAGHTTIAEGFGQNPTDYYSDYLADWSDECEDLASDFERWDRNAFWSHVLSVNPRIGGKTQLFVNTWLDTALRPDAVLTESEPLKRLIMEREQSQKSQSRLTTPKLLASWSGGSGTGRLNYRWFRVRGIVGDIHDGLDRAAT